MWLLVVVVFVVVVAAVVTRWWLSLLLSPRWGGDIEVSIFHDFFDLEICVVNIVSNTLLGIHHDGGDELTSSSATTTSSSRKNGRRRVYLLYDGVHYDAAVCTAETGAGGGSGDGGGGGSSRVDQTVFLRDDAEVELAVRRLMAELHGRCVLRDVCVLARVCACVRARV